MILREAFLVWRDVHTGADGVAPPRVGTSVHVCFVSRSYPFDHRDELPRRC
jgi:hypothetical protein